MRTFCFDTLIATLLIGGLAMTALVATQAPDAATLAAIAGKEKKPHQQTAFVSPPLTAAESKTLQAKLQALRAALLETPTLRTLRGYDWATYGRIDGHEPGRPLKLRLGYIAYPYWFNARANRTESSAEGPSFDISINDPEVLLGGGTYLVDQEARFTYAPSLIGELDGFPVYIAGEHFVVITKVARPIFVPVTQQHFLEVRIAQARAALASVQTSLAALPESPSKRTALANAEKRLTALEAELAAMPEAQRAAAALAPDGGRTTRPSFLAEPDATKTRAIVEPNRELFDPKQPRTSIQLIILGSIRSAPALYEKVQAEIDKTALRRLLD
jgi:hypothetical protein